MTQSLTIEFWSDYVCPFCYIGKRRLESALKHYDGDVKIIHKSFQLNPDAKRVAGIPYAEIIGAKYGLSLTQAQKNIDHVVNMAKSVGLDYNLDHLIHNNTKNAHRLTKYADTFGLAGAMEERILKAYFTECQDIGDLNVLASLAEAIGLNRRGVAAFLETTTFTPEVFADQLEAHERGISSVPHFIINGTIVSGAQDQSVFLAAFQNTI